MRQGSGRLTMQDSEHQGTEQTLKLFEAWLQQIKMALRQPEQQSKQAGRTDNLMSELASRVITHHD